MLMRALNVQGKVIQALFLRELKTRFGDKRLGFLWAFMEPVLHVAGFAAIWMMVGKLGPHGVNTILYLITGIIPYLMFSNTVNKVMKSIDANHALLVFPQIRPIDFVFSRILMEFTTYTTVFLVFLVMLRFYGVEFEVKNALGVISAFFLIPLLGGGLGFLLIPISAVFKMTQHIVRLCMRIMYITSGVFFSIEKLSIEYRPYIIWNPLFNIMHNIRANFFPQFELREDYANLGYLFTLILLFWLFGFVLLKKLYKYVLES